MLPFTPLDAKGLISDPTSSLCGNLVRTLLRVPVLFYQLVSELFDENGTSKSAFRAGDTKYSFSAVGEDEHWKLCNGQSLDKTTYSILFAAIGSTFDTMPNADGSAVAAPGGNLFRVPRCGARFPLATGALAVGGAVSNGSVGGEEQHTLTTLELPAHTHPPAAGVGFFATFKSDYTTDNLADGALQADTSTEWVGSRNRTGEEGGDDPHNTVPPYFGVYLLICTGI